MPRLPSVVLPILLTERWDSYASVSHIPTNLPVLLMSGLQDKIVPPSEMKRLRTLREKSGGKMRWKEFDAEHNDTILAKGYWEEVRDWLIDEFEAGVMPSPPLPQDGEEKRSGAEDISEKEWDVLQESDFEKTL